MKQKYELVRKRVPESIKAHSQLYDDDLDAPPASSCVSFSDTTLHPIHRSMGVSLSESITERCRDGAAKASLTPSNNPMCRADEVFCVRDEPGTTENASLLASKDAVSAILDIMVLTISKSVVVEQVILEYERRCGAKAVHTGGLMPAQEGVVVAPHRVRGAHYRVVVLTGGSVVSTSTKNNRAAERSFTTQHKRTLPTTLLDFRPFVLVE